MIDPEESNREIEYRGIESRKKMASANIRQLLQITNKTWPDISIELCKLARNLNFEKVKVMPHQKRFQEII